MDIINKDFLGSNTNGYHQVLVPEYPKKILLGIEEDTCNLSCPKCLVFGTNKDPNFDIKQVATSSMPMNEVTKILREIKGHDTAITPSFWVEPLVAKQFKQVLVEAKRENVPVAICTNGLLINGSMAEFLVGHTGVISVSIDATTSETLIKTRATSRLKRIHDAVALLLEKRGSSEFPRIMVNFTVEEENLHERDEFLNHWINIVDAVRINEMYTYERSVDGMPLSRERTPCREIYDQMIIDFNGDVRMCCLDGFRKTNLGNVFEDGVYNVWHGEALTAVRTNHEESNYKNEPFCESCNLWASYNISNEREEGDLLIRSSDSITFYNRLDKLSNWKSEIRRNDLKFQSKSEKP